MISREILKNVRRIEITTSKYVEDLLGGEYESVFKGQGIEFADVREYVPGDDVRSIDWNVTARSQTPFIKQFIEERELTVLFMLDASGSCSFGSPQKVKSEIMAEICALLAFAATKNNDKIGVAFFSDQIEKFIPLKKGKRHVLRVIREILSFQPKSAGTDYLECIKFAGRIMTRRAVIFIISDFLDLPQDMAQLKILSKRHDVIAIEVNDPLESAIPKAGKIHFQDAETGKSFSFNSDSRKVLAKYADIAAKRKEKNKEFFKSLGIDIVSIDTSRPYLDPIVGFFRKREKRRS